MLESRHHTARARINDPDALVVKATLLLVSTLTPMAGAIIAPALPAMEDYFAGEGESGLLVRLVLTVPALFIVIGSPISGYIVDRLGRKQLLVVSAILYGVSGASAYVIRSLAFILIGRALLGLAVAGIMTCATTLIADYYSGRERIRFLGFQAAMMGLGATVFLSMGGLLADIDWGVPFLIYGVSLLMVPFIMLWIFEPDRRAKTIILDVDALSVEPEKAPIRLMVFVYGVLLLTQIVFYTIPVHLPFYLKDLTDATASQSGFVIALQAFFIALSSSLFGWVDAHLSHVQVVIATFLLSGISWIMVGLADGWFLVLVGMPIGGMGMGLVLPNFNGWLANESPAPLRGRVLGGVATAVFMGRFLTPIASEPIINLSSIGGMYTTIGVVLLILGSIFLLNRSLLHRLTAT